MNDYKIWISYHKDEFVKQYHLREDNNHKLFATHKDASGININYMNPVYSEMVTMYYVWKNNLYNKYVGFNHYRRQFSVTRFPLDNECQIFRVLDFGNKTIYNQYAQCHNSKDMDTIIHLLNIKFGKQNPYSEHILHSYQLISNCCFLMTWENFIKLCEFLFPLLKSFALANNIYVDTVEAYYKKAFKDFNGQRVQYQTRVLSFLAERLISAWINAHLLPYVKPKKIGIIHYNTPELTTALIKSLYKHTGGCQIYIFDNSNKRPFTTNDSNVKIIDNTKCQIINFDLELEKYPRRIMRDARLSNFGSFKHCISVDKLMDIINDEFVLLDSDVILKKDISDFFNNNYACCGNKQFKHDIPRLTPYLCYLNVPLLKKNNIRYFNKNKMWAMTQIKPYCDYDTGAWILEDVNNKKLPFKCIDINQYIVHLKAGSWANKNKVNEWLQENEDLWK